MLRSSVVSEGLLSASRGLARHEENFKCRLMVADELPHGGGGGGGRGTRFSSIENYRPAKASIETLEARYFLKIQLAIDLSRAFEQCSNFNILDAGIHSFTQLLLNSTNK